MRQKILIGTAAVSFISQIVFSIYYSSIIVDQNNLINSLQSKYDTLTRSQQSIEKDLSDSLSLSKIKQSNSNFQTINNSLDFDTK